MAHSLMAEATRALNLTSLAHGSLALGPRVVPGMRTVDFFALVLGEEASVNVLACCFLLAVALSLGYASKLYKWIYFPESSAALVLGMFFGVLTKQFSEDHPLAFKFSPEVFFYGLLPIIIFNAGYGLKKRDFFRNFASIMLFAVVGTVISTLVYGLLTYWLFTRGLVTHLVSESPLLESLMFGSLISAIDPVATLSIFQEIQAPAVLYNIVFGESLVNDAASIVLFRTFESFLDEPFGFASIANAILRFTLISVGSIVLGVLVSLVGALALRVVEVRTEFCKWELSIILISAYVSYSVAELLSLSGIMALFFCGICNAHYSYYSTTHAAKVSSKYAFEALAFMAEMFVFVYLGMQVVVSKQVVDTGLIVTALPLCFISRAANIFPLAWLANRSRKKKIPTNMKLAMWFAGLRGAIAFALSVNMPTRNEAIETTTLFVVIITTLVLGGATAPLLMCLGLVSVEEEEHERLDLEFLRRASAKDTFDEDNSELHNFHQAFKWFDSKFLKPVFGGQMEVSQETLTQRNAKVVAKIGELLDYRSASCALKVPSLWTPVLSQYAVLAFTSGPGDEAEVDVLTFTEWAAEEETDPAGFLLKHWSQICPELSPPADKPEDLAPKVQKTHSHSSFRFSPSMRRADHSAVLMQRVASLPHGEEEDGTSSPLLAGQAGAKSPPPPPAPPKGGRIVPAFVMHCDHSPGDSICDLFRFEIVAHPEDLGGLKSEVQHYYVAVWRNAERSRVFACRVRASESFVFEVGVLPLVMILDSFKVEEHAAEEDATVVLQ